MRIFLLFLVFLFSKSYGAGIIDHDQTELIIYTDATVTIKKVTNTPEMELLIQTVFDAAMADDHLENLHYCLQSPFGVYIAYEQESMTPVAIQSFGHGEKSDHLCAYPHTNVLEAHQGRKYGSLLRAQTAKYFDDFLGSPVKIDGEELSHLPLSFLASTNEWFFGENHPALKSALNAGYGIESIDFYGTLDMRYPSNADSWSPSRVAAITEFSKIMMNPSSTSSPSIMSAAMEHMRTILSDLDYTKEADITTLLSVAERVIKITNPDSFEGPDYLITLERKTIYQAIYDGPLREVFEGLSEEYLTFVKNFVGKGYSPLHNFNGVLKHAESMRWIGALT